ncbi:MAG TPA: alpha-L-arabinofuranosidase C-terminal domain-containing protein, partial [Bacteroidota bacterium]|nr:alpha-L-arabinofuranosidase C-terminal domain-containing protein [Bacteroidota bacterium]
VLEVEHIGTQGTGLKNSGFDRMNIRAGETYDLSLFARQISKDPMTLMVSLQTPSGKIVAENKISTSSLKWKQYAATLTATESSDSASLVVLAVTKGKLALDEISLFPEKTFKNRKNGLRSDLAQMIAEMKPKFIRFPGGCLAHGDGLGNMYRWKNTIGPIEQRKQQRNIWQYHQTTGLGFFEYFQFCEDIGAKPLPVLPAAVCCQNSGGTWRIGGTGQQALPMSQMNKYIQDVLDLIEWANGPATSTWGKKRAEAGHPAPFKLEYLGIGNEDKITPEFTERFTKIYQAVRAKHPEISIIGTAGPFHSGEDFDKGWALSRELHIPVMDEHYYVQPEWFIANQHRYDSYKRNESHVYLGEYASWGNKMRNAIAEAIYMTSLERNGDVVRLASYAPMLAKKGFTQWTTDMLFFDNVNIIPTPNYYVQKMFMTNQGDVYYDNVVTANGNDTTAAGSCVQDSQSGDLILKLVNAGSTPSVMKINLSKLVHAAIEAQQTLLKGEPEAENTFDHPRAVLPVTSTYTVGPQFDYSAPAMSLTVMRIKTKN